MLSSKRICTASADVRVAHGMVIALTVLVAGCSADVTRFDFPSFGLTGKGDETGSIANPPESVARRDRGYEDAPGTPPRRAGVGDPGRGDQGRGDPGPSYARPNDRVASAPDYGPPPSAGYNPSQDRAQDRANAKRYDRPQTTRAPATGESIEVQQGDTLYGIAKRYGVSISALIEVNALKNGQQIKPGQQLYLPAGVPASKIARESQREQPREAQRMAPPASTASLKGGAPAPASPALASKPGWGGQHTMKQGESLYGIARKHNVSLAELQRVNGITSPTSVRAGTVLSVPGSAGADAAPTRAATAPSAPPRAAQAVLPANQPRVINATGEQKTAAIGTQRNDAGEPAPAASPAPQATAAAAPGKFRWPARGRVIASFGKRPDGTHNDGINIAIPQGTDVHAAEGGRVAYAGNELKGYGNLVLIRHDNGWVSAYAHADQVLVKRDDIVRRGQVIAKAGKTGTVDQPQLHFELRQGAKPVDPMPHMEK